MTAISLDVTDKLAPERERVLRDVAEAAVALGIPFFVVGAFARDLILELHYGLPVQRATNDIDFGLQVNSWEEFAQLKTTLIQIQAYRADPHQPQRLHSSTGEIIDIVPFGGVEDATTRTILWPPECVIEMNAFGFAEAYQQSLRVHLATDLEVQVSSLAGLALMKLIAWKQRRQTKDAKDLQLILTRYLQAGNLDRLYSDAHADLLAEEQFISLDLAGARLLGRDIAALLSDVSKQEVLKIMADSTLLVGSMVGGAFDVEDALTTAQLRLDMLANGVADNLSNESA
jgi:predicted nucleotidyltransferase